MFTHQHYKTIAAIIDSQAVVCPPAHITGNDKTVFMLGVSDQRDFYIRAFANAFASDNPRFDREKFIQACNGEEVFCAMFTRQHYKTIATCLASTAPPAHIIRAVESGEHVSQGVAVWITMRNTFADAFASNPDFDWDEFIQACNGEEV